MKHLLCGTVIAAALVSAAPVLAQTGPYSPPPGPYVTPTAQFRAWWPDTSAQPGAGHARKHHKRYTRYIAPPVYARRSHLAPIYIPPVR